MARSDKKRIQGIIKKLKSRNRAKLDDAFHEYHKKVFNDDVNCLDCANCCITLGPRLTDNDIERLAGYLKIKPSQFVRKYLRIDEDGDYVFKQMPCPFLDENNLCMVYEQRPKACKGFPHTDRRKMYQILDLTGKNAHVCPAVYLMLKQIDA